MVKKMTWKEFQETGLLWWTNMILHTFGWAICYDFDNEGNLNEVYPARVKFRGFNDENNSNGYIKVSEYLKREIGELLEEAYE